MMKLQNRRSMIEDVHSLFHLGAMGTWVDGQLVSHFVSEQVGSDLAFRVLIHRHGPMVLRVCRRVLGDSHAAEDAFQATFLVLVKKADSIRDRGVLTGWLYGVALRVARKARAQAARRGVVERQAAERSGEVSEDPGRDEVRLLVQEEIARLPERYREPLVLCYLEGLRHHEIAERLECPVGTVESRLSRGRERLRSRLERRGLAPTAAPGAMLMMAQGVPATVPAALVEATVRLALAFAWRKDVVGVAATSAATLARATAWPHLGPSALGLVACAGLVVVGLGAYGSWVPRTGQASPPVVQPEATPGPKPAAIPAPVPVPPAGETPPDRPPAPILPGPRPRPSRPDSAVAVPLAGISVDGRLDDWPAGLDRHPIRRRLVGNAGHDSTSEGPDAVPRAHFRVGYDQATGRIYLAVEVEDEDLVYASADPWHTDAVEVYVEGRFTEDSIPEWIQDASKLPVVQYAAVPGPVGAYGDPKGANPSLLYGQVARSTTKMAYRRSGNMTTYEWAIQVFDRYPDRPTRLEPGKRVGLEVVVVDKDRDRPRSTWLHWGPTWAGFKGLDAGSLGELILVDGP